MITHALTILHTYDETRRNAPDLLTGDGQRIPVYVVVCKIACDCGYVGLEELTIVDEPPVQ